MLTIQLLKEFFGWATVINVGFLVWFAVMVVFFRNMMLNIHTKLFGLEKEYLEKTYFNYLALYKIFTIIFCFVPYIVLAIMV